MFAVLYIIVLRTSLSTTDQTASCMVCNTNVNVPTPNCGVSEAQVSALELTVSDFTFRFRFHTQISDSWGLMSLIKKYVR